MDGGSFYSQGVSLSRSQIPGMGYSSMPPSGSYRSEHIPLASSSSHGAGMEIGFGQKLDQIASLICEQAKETASMKQELRSLKCEMEELKESNNLLAGSVTSSSAASTPIALQKKIPTELSVRNKKCIVLVLLLSFIS